MRLLMATFCPPFVPFATSEIIKIRYTYYNQKAMI